MYDSWPVGSFMTCKERVAMSPRVLSAACAACLVGILTSCGGRESSVATPAKAQGSEGGSCFPDGTCLDGLACVSDLCVSPDSGSAGSGGTVGGHTVGVLCGSVTCPLGQACCSGDSGVACGTGVTPSDPCYAANHPNVASGFVGFDTKCDDNGDCEAGEECCALAGNYVEGLSCFPKSAIMPCLSAFGPVCRSDADCPTGTLCSGAFAEQPEWKWCMY